MLLNCYTKLQDVARLDEFILWKHVPYDIESAIQTLRQGGCVCVREGERESVYVCVCVRVYVRQRVCVARLEE